MGGTVRFDDRLEERMGVGDRRQIIVDCAAALFARQGVAATTVRQIADEAGILSGSLYHHFSSKDAIVEAVVVGFLEDLVAQYEKVVLGTDDAQKRLIGLVDASITVGANHPHATDVYQNEVRYLNATEGSSAVATLARRVRQVWLSVLNDGVENGAFRNDVPVKVVYPLLRDGLWLTSRWFHPTRAYGHQQLANDYLKIFLEGILR
jgi:AcrR family transcriptional regulator